MNPKVLFSLVAAAFIVATTSDAFWFGKKKDKADAAPAAAMEVAEQGGTIPVESTLLKALKYDEASSVLTVQFVKGDTYEYKNVPKSRYDAMMQSDSKGAYFRANIRDKYKSVKK